MYRLKEDFIKWQTELLNVKNVNMCGKLHLVVKVASMDMKLNVQNAEV